MPVFNDFVEEARLIGKLLAGYGELELELCDCLVAVRGDLSDALTVMWSARGEKNRISTAKDAVKADYIARDLGQPFFDGITNMQWCRRVRNQYAHCQWYPKDGRLCFVEIESMLDSHEPIDRISDGRTGIDADLLKEQISFFDYTRQYFWYLAGQYRVSVGKLHKSSFPMPPKRPQPAMHKGIDRG